MPSNQQKRFKRKADTNGMREREGEGRQRNSTKGAKIIQQKDRKQTHIFLKRYNFWTRVTIITLTKCDMMLSLCREGCLLNSTTSPSMRWRSTMSPYWTMKRREKRNRSETMRIKYSHTLRSFAVLLRSPYLRNLQKQAHKIQSMQHTQEIHPSFYM